LACIHQSNAAARGGKGIVMISQTNKTEKMKEKKKVIKVIKKNDLLDKKKRLNQTFL
jgi:uncharacterized ubiquitin-like protein YukD